MLRAAASRWRRGAAVACLLVPASCTTHRASVDQRMLLPASAQHYVLEERQRFLMPLPIVNDPPDLPAALQKRELLPVTVCIEITVNASGIVDSLRALHDAEGCTTDSGPEVAALRDAVASTVTTWRFEPALVCTFATAQALSSSAGACAGHDAIREAISVRLAYAFTFEVRNGRKHVQAGRIKTIGESLH